MENKVIKAGLLGAGTVGGGTFRLLQMRKDELVNRVGANIEITKVLVRNPNKKREGFPMEVLTDNWESIINDPEISIVIELMGGIEPARTYITQALEHGKHVVTANKDLIATHGFELMNLADKMHCDLLFEAAVAGGIPIIRPLRECLEGNNITEVMGIVNGTTNFILTEMTQKGMAYSIALKQAQELGYAEADPTADVEGLDAGRKVAILASLAFHTKVTFDDVDIKGISAITAEDISFAKQLGFVIKLIGIARNTDGEVEAGVAPMMIPMSHPLANVNGSFNAIFLHGDAVDDAMFQGRGAGSLPTASAVVGDIIAIARNTMCGCNGRIGNRCYNTLPIQASGDAKHKFFMRVVVEDKPGMLAQLASILGGCDVGISQVVQTNDKEADGLAELVIITHSVPTRSIEAALAAFRSLPSVREVSSVIRVYGQN